MAFSAYDFTSSKAQAYGSNIVQVSASPNNFAMYSGDVNDDGLVELSDIINVFNDAESFQSGYAISDLNGDNLVTLADLIIVYNNASMFVSEIKP
jgi:hypothetical protein